MRRIMLPVVAVVLTGMAGCACHKDTVTLTPLSGRYGYHFEGPMGLQGTLTKDNLTDPEWRLEGKFVFPTGGHALLEPDIQIAESYPEQVFIKFTVMTPGPNEMVTMVVTEVPFSQKIPASNEAVFSMTVTTVQRLL
ncbi:MAG: hypothetical protein H3C30_05000 [Candidatus Hydrogenedentes bacterium]|nr:hypothetical protein [Candidatus Hydrogenedentota bacterium]